MTAKVLGSKLRTNTLERSPQAPRGGPLTQRDGMVPLLLFKGILIQFHLPVPSSIISFPKLVFLAEGRTCKGLKIQRAESWMAKILQKFLFCKFDLEKDTWIPKENELYWGQIFWGYFISEHRRRASAVPAPELSASRLCCDEKRAWTAEASGARPNLAPASLGTFGSKSPLLPTTPSAQQRWASRHPYSSFSTRAYNVRLLQTFKLQNDIIFHGSREIFRGLILFPNK